MTWQNETWAKDACSELVLSMDNFQSDDKKPPTLQMAMAEAQYIIDLHYEAGTVSNEMLNGEHGPDEKKRAKKTIADCNKFIKKYKASRCLA